jgi:hypothetical protein
VRNSAAHLTEALNKEAEAAPNQFVRTLQNRSRSYKARDDICPGTVPDRSETVMILYTIRSTHTYIHIYRYREREIYI